ncbi:MAG TPA: hypothetical protein VFM18_03410, partial [Methanosarcina sp.]|nr:hypothetical protein [Methanosarcina sp.]
VRLETGKTLGFSLNSQVSGISHGNINFAMIEPKLFTFWLLEGNILHIVCPYTQPYTPTLGVYLDRYVRGEINL